MNRKRIVLTVVAAFAFVLPWIPLHQKGDLRILSMQAGVLIVYAILFVVFKK